MKELTIEISGHIGMPESEQFDIDDNSVSTYERFKQIMDENKDSERIIVDIRSTGGRVKDAVLIYNDLKEFDGEVITCGYGYVASSATIIGQAASKGCRKLSANALYLIHSASMTVKGNKEAHNEAVDELEYTDEQIALLYSNNSLISQKEYLSLMSENDGNGKWLTPQEALEWQLIDEIIPIIEQENENDNR